MRKQLRNPKLSRKELRAMLALAESEVEEQIDIAKKRSEQAVERARKIEERKVRRIELRCAIGDLASAASTSYLYEVGVRNKKLAHIQEEQRVAKHLVERTEPEWMRALDALKSEIDLFGFDDRTLWRHKTRNALLELTGNFSGLEHMAPAVDQMASILKRINLLSASEMRREMTQVEALACAGEKTVNELYRRSLSKEAALKGRWEQQRKDAAEHMSGRRRDARNKLEEMSTEVFLTEDFRLTEGRMAGGPCWMKPPSVQEYVTRIDALRRCVVARDSEAEIKAMYQGLLSDCGRSGAWQDAIVAYGDFVAKGLVPDAHLFTTLMRSCKNAEPIQPQKAVQIFEEMVRMGVEPTTTHFNAVVDICRIAKEWRRALYVFGKMKDFALEASNATLDTVCAACATAPLEDASAVYEAMKFAGVPEYLSYLTVQKLVEQKGDEMPSRLSFLDSRK